MSEPGSEFVEWIGRVEARLAALEELSGVFAEIDAAEFERARLDPKRREFAKVADDLLARLRAEGRIR